MERQTAAGGQGRFFVEALARLQAAGLRLTAPRRLLLEVLPAKDGFRAEDLWQAARRRHPGLGRATVFRTLELFARLGIVDRVDRGDGSPHYRTCAVTPDTDHHHLVCESCGASVEVEDTEVAPVLAALSRR